MPEIITNARQLRLPARPNVPIQGRNQRLILAIRRNTVSQWLFAGKWLAGGSGGRSGCAGAGTGRSPACCARTAFVHRICARYSAFSAARRWNSLVGGGGRRKTSWPTTGCASDAAAMNGRFIGARFVFARCPSSWLRAADAPRGRLIPRVRWDFRSCKLRLPKHHRDRAGQRHVNHFPNDIHGSLELVGGRVGHQRVPLRRITGQRLEGRELARPRTKSVGRIF